MKRLGLTLLLGALAPACTYDATDVHVELAPQVISSLDGTLTVRATVYHEEVALHDEDLQITVTYTDRTGTAHTIAPVDGISDDKGVFEATLTGFSWDGTGTVTVTLPGTEISGHATFAVLDRTPPSATILPSETSVPRGTDTSVDVHVTDEIGVSQVIFESVVNVDGNTVGRERSTVATAGLADAMVTFEFGVNDGLPIGATITLYALVIDLAGNQRAATPVTITVAGP